MNKIKYIVLNGDEIVAYIYESIKYGLTVIFITSKIDIVMGLSIYDVFSNDTGRVDDPDLMELVLVPFPKVNKICKSCELGLCPNDRGGFIPCTICGREYEQNIQEESKNTESLPG